MSDIIERTIAFLGGRKRAYQFTFQKNQPHVAYVDADLVRFAHMNEDCPHTDPFEIGKWLGRQEVVRRIFRHRYLSPEELFALYSGVRTQPREISS